jgi:hypothetical protein
MHKGIHNKKFVIFNSIMIVIVIGIIVIGSNYQKQSLETTTEQVANYENNRVIYMKEKNVIANEQLFDKEDESVENTDEDELEEETEEVPEVEEVETESIPLYTAKDTTETGNDSAPTKPTKKPTTTNNTSTNEASTKVEDIKDKDEVIKEEEKEPVITTKIKEEEQPISYKKIEKEDSGILKGEMIIIQEGVDGVAIVTYEYIYTDGKYTKKVKLSTREIKKPINQIIVYGTKEPPVEEPIEPVEPEEPVKEDNSISE